MKPETTQVNEDKVKIVEELSNLLKNKKTVLIASIKNLPASQFQNIGKSLRGRAIVKVPKKNLILRAIDESKNEEIKKIKDYIKENTAILFSDLESFELAAELSENKSPVKAKTGQEAPEDIKVEAGPTDLLPGPAITELGSLGIQIQIEKGKITIKESKVIVKKNEKISENASNIMNKLDIKPFSVGFIPLVALDNENGKLYLEIKIDKKETIKELKDSFARALSFAIEINYSSGDTIKFLISKANSHGKVIENLMGKEKSEEKVKEENSENETKKNNQPKQENSKEEN